MALVKRLFALMLVMILRRKYEEVKLGMKASYKRRSTFESPERITQEDTMFGEIINPQAIQMRKIIHT